MDVLLPVFQLLYFVVHFLYSLAQAVTDCFHELYHMIFNIIRWKKRFIPSSNQILADASQLKKLPRHLGIILMSKQTVNYKHICHVVSWSVGFGIHNISLYDWEGILKLKLPSLLDNIVVVCPDVIVRVLLDDQIYVRETHNILSENYKHLTRRSKDFRSGLTEASVQSKLQTTCKTKQSMKTVVTLRILSIEDGKDNIVSAAKALCKLDTGTLNPDIIQGTLITKDQLDPDLVIILGRPTCTIGFLPWQIRLTEFLNIPSATRLDYNQFRKQLQIYSKCQQRCGS